MSEERSIGLALLGGGIVGGGVAEILTAQHELLRQRTGLSFDIRHVIVRDVNKRAGELPPGVRVHADAHAAIDDPKVQIVVELIGGVGVAAKYVERALELGKPVVTANKSLLASRGPELFALAKRHNTCIAFEGSAGGGVPIVHALVRSLVGNRID